jgi:hypothetical protein
MFGKITGKVQASHVQDGIWTPATAWQDNLVLYEWGDIVGKLLAGEPDGKPYAIGGMYLEYESNVDAAINPTPTFDRTGGVQTAPSYWENLGTNRDYLRVKLDSATVTSGVNSVTVTFVTQSTGTVGAKTTSPVAFSDSVNSRVYGCAIVAYPDFSDKSQDLVLSRYYFASAYQIEKAPGSNIGITWPITLS